VADLLRDLGNLGVHRLVVESHGIKLGGQLADGLTNGLISLALSHYEVLHKALQVRLRLRRWRRWVVGSSILLPRQLHRTLRYRVEIFVEIVGVALSSRIILIGVRMVLC